MGSRTIRGMSWNLSQGGMQLGVSQLQVRDNVRLSFRLPVSGVSIDVNGIVAWATTERQGIQFITPSATALQSIRKYISEVEKD